MRKKLNLLFLCIFFTGKALAASYDEVKNFLRIEGDYQQANNELNALYDKMIDEYKQLKGEFYGQNESRDLYLIKSQQAWLVLRDANCAYETYESRIGSGFSSIYKKCLFDKTIDRINYLKDNY